MLEEVNIYIYLESIATLVILLYIYISLNLFIREFCILRFPSTLYSSSIYYYYYFYYFNINRVFPAGFSNTLIIFYDG